MCTVYMSDKDDAKQLTLSCRTNILQDMQRVRLIVIIVNLSTLLIFCDAKEDSELFPKQFTVQICIWGILCKAIDMHLPSCG